MGRRYRVLMCGLMLGTALALWASWVALAQVAKDEVFQKLKEADALFMRGFTVTATRVLPPLEPGAPEVTTAWQMTLEGSRCAVIEEAVSHGSPSYVWSERGPFGLERSAEGNLWVNFPKVRYNYYGPDFSALYHENALSEVDPAGTVVKEGACRRALLFDPGAIGPNHARDSGLRSMGRGFSGAIKGISKVKALTGGRIKLWAESGEEHYSGTWELTVEPEAGWMVREAWFRNTRGKLSRKFANEGLIRAGALAIPQTAEILTTTFLSDDLKTRVSFETLREGFDEALFQRARVATREPYPAGTMISDRRGGQVRESWVTSSGEEREAVIGPQACRGCPGGPEPPGRPWYVLPRDLAFIGLVGAAIAGAVLLRRIRGPSRI